MKIYLLVIICISPILAQDGLWDMIIRKEQIVLDVEYNGRLLSVWKEDKGNYSRFYVTPLCEIISQSLKCHEDRYTDPSRHILMFKVRVWNKAVAEKVQLELKSINIEASTAHILPLPMQKIKLDINQDILTNLYADRSWRSNQNQPSIIQFGLYAKSSSSCQEILNDAIYDIEAFLVKVRPVFEFSLTVGSQESRHLNITGNVVTTSSFYAKLQNSIDKNGIVYLTSDDMNKLSRDVLHTVLLNDVSTASYVPSAQEDNIIMELFNIIKDQKVQSDNFTQEEWNSVFWDDIYTRPDIQTEYLNEVLTHQEGSEHFKYNHEKENEFYGKLDQRFKESNKGSSGGGGGISIFGFGIGGSKSKSHEYNREEHQVNETHTKQREFNSTDELRTFLDKENVHVRWTGEKFEQKPMDLYRVNTRDLQSSGQLLYKRVVLTMLNAVSEFEITPETPWYIPPSTMIPPQAVGRPSILLWPGDLVPIRNQIFAENLNNSETAKRIYEILSSTYSRDKYFVAVWTRKSGDLTEEARLFSKSEIADSISLWEHKPVIETPPKEADLPIEENPSSNNGQPPPPESNVPEPPPNPPARRKRNALPKRACLIFRSTLLDYSTSMKVFDEGRNKVPKILPNFNATMDVWRVLRPVFNEYFPFMALIQWDTDLHATWYMSGEGMNVNDKYLLFVGFD